MLSTRIRHTDHGVAFCFWMHEFRVWHLFVIRPRFWTIRNRRVLYTRVIALGPVMVALTDLRWPMVLEG